MRWWSLIIIWNSSGTQHMRETCHRVWLWNNWHKAKTLTLWAFHPKHQTGVPVYRCVSWCLFSSTLLVRPSSHRAAIILWWHHHHLALLLVFKWMILVCIMEDFNFKSGLAMKVSVSFVSCFPSDLLLLSSGASNTDVKLWKPFVTWMCHPLRNFLIC